MSNWNWKWECCLIIGGLLVGGPLGTLILKTLRRTVQYGSHSQQNSYPFNLVASESGGSGDSSNSFLSLLVPSSLWFVVTTSCVGGFFWLLGEVLRKLHSVTRVADAGARERAAAVAREEAQGGGGGGEGQAGRERREWGEGVGGLLGHDHNYQIHHPARRLIFPFLPHGRARLWGLSFL
ncbi:unnamed protein product [Orchesella dallaii]|uniref:Transmembrane protein n=1 Tax=Orchesella dallaii TaxID=48710 RepID=A0ABP1R0A5_9HEXA